MISSSGGRGQKIASAEPGEEEDGSVSLHSKVNMTFVAGFDSGQSMM
jgi:hypothetical protein